MSDNKLKIDVVLADVGESGAVLSDFVTQEIHNTDMAKKADLVNGKVVPTQLPEFSELSGVTDVFSQLEINLRENINTSLTDSKAYADSIVSEVMSKKADLVGGRVPSIQATEFKNIPGAKGAIDGLKQSFRTSIATLREEVQVGYAGLNEGRVSKTQLPLDTVFDYDLAEVKQETIEMREINDAVIDIIQTDLTSDITMPDGSVQPSLRKLVFERLATVASVTGDVTADSIAEALMSDSDLMQASNLKMPDGKTQQDINDFGGAEWRSKEGGYKLGATAKLENGDIVKSTVADNVIDPNVDMTGWVKTNDASQIFDASGKNQQEINNLLSYASYKTPRQFGGKPNDPNYDNKFALQAALDSKDPILLDGFYYTTSSPAVTSNTILVGFGVNTSAIVKVGDSIATLGSVPISSTASDNYNIDAILIAKGGAYTLGSIYVGNLCFRNFSLRRHNATYTDALDRYGFYAPRLKQSFFEDFTITNRNISETGNSQNLGTAWFSANFWMACLDRVEVSGRYGFKINGGTSLTFNSCWSAGNRLRAYDFDNLRYTTMNSCGADYTGSAENPAEYVYNLGNSAITMNGCSAENAYCKLVRVGDSAHVVANNIEFVSGIFGDGTYTQLIDSTGNAVLILNGGRIRRSDTCTNAVYASRYSAVLRVLNVIENFTFTVSRSANASSRDQAIVNSGTSVFYHNDNSWAYDESSLPNAEKANGITVRNGGFLHTGTSGNIGFTAFTAGEWNTNLLRLGRSRIWNATVDSAAALYFKRDSDPTSVSDGLLINALRAVSATAPSTKITGQHYLNTSSNKPFWWNGTGWFDSLGNPSSTTKPIITGLKTPTTLAEQVAVNDSIVTALVTLGLVTDSRT